MPIDNEVALVTGASRGIGRAIAQALAREGARVVGTATSEDSARAIDEQLAAHGGRGLVLDVTDPESVSDLVGTVQGEVGPPTILVNNAGITRDNLLLRMKESEWDAVIDTNLSGLYRMCKACARGMIKARHGRIVNIASVVGATGNAGQSNYAAAKAGVIGFTKSLARELASRGVTVNAVAPGFIDTDMTRGLDEVQRAALIGDIPLGRLGTGEDVAAAVVYLASAAGGYVTGETLHVNGGMYMA